MEPKIELLNFKQLDAARNVANARQFGGGGIGSLFDRGR